MQKEPKGLPPKYPATIKEFTWNRSFHIEYHFRQIEKVKTPYVTAVMGENRHFGKMLFIDDEIQVTESDFDLYHDQMSRCIQTGLRKAHNTRILVVGDGDGGFTRYPWSRYVDYVERDKAIMDLGTKYFDAQWANCNSVTVQPYESFLKASKKKYPRGLSYGESYDYILMALTDDFNRTHTSNGLMAQTIQHFLRPGGTIAIQSGTTLDYDYKRVLDWNLEVLQGEGLKVTHNKVYIPSFFSEISFLEGKMT